MITVNRSNPNHYVRVNDFYLNLQQAPGEIKIAHGTDTMYLFQPSESIIELNFTPGYHFLPSWSRFALKGLPQLRRAEFVNIDQKHFVVSKADYDSLRIEFQEVRYLQKRRMEQEIAENFSKDFLHIDYDYLPLKTIRDPLPYGTRGLETTLYPTHDEHVHIAMTGFRLHEANCVSFKDYFTRIDLNKHTVEYWFPVENTREFGSSAHFFKIDPFNQSIYLRVFFYEDKNRIGQDCAFSEGIERIMYKSYDFGKSWKKDPQFTELYNEYEFKKYEFIDQHYSIGYTFQKIKEKSTNYMIDQGVFYLLKDSEVVDTFLTPKDVRFNTNYANYRYKRVSEDSVFLGSWGYNESNYMKSKPCHIYAVKTNNEWKIEIITDQFHPYAYKEDEVQTDYENFTVNGDTLTFNNGAKMFSRGKIIDNPLGQGIFPVEQGEHIYLFDTQNRCMYISFDARATWIFNPKSPLNKGNMLFLGINSRNKLSFFNRKDFAEETVRFGPVN